MGPTLQDTRRKAKQQRVKEKGSVGINHGGIRDETPRIWSGDVNSNCPPPAGFVMFQNFEHQIACITML